MMKHILIIDDRPAASLVLMSSLERQAYQVEVTVNRWSGAAAYRHGITDLVMINLFMAEKKGAETVLQFQFGDWAVRFVMIVGRMGFLLSTPNRYIEPDTYQQLLDIEQVLKSVEKNLDESELEIRRSPLRLWPNRRFAFQSAVPRFEPAGLKTKPQQTMRC